MGPTRNPCKTAGGPVPNDAETPDSGSGVDALPDGVIIYKHQNGRSALSHPDDDTTVACPDCDTGRELYIRTHDNVSHNPDDPVRCQPCGWTGEPDEVVVRAIHCGNNRGHPSPKGGTLARKLLDADPDDLMTDGGEWRCDSCGDIVPVRYLEDGICVGCQHREHPRIVTDGGRDKDVDPRAVINHDELPGTEHDELALNVARAYADHVNRGADHQEAAGCVSGVASSICDEAGVPPEVRVGSMLAAYDVDLDQAEHIARLMTSDPEHTGGVLSRLRRVAAGWFA